MNRLFSALFASALIVSMYALPSCADQSKSHSSEHDEPLVADGHDEDGPGGAGHDEGGHAHDNASYSVGEPADMLEVDRTVAVLMSDAMTYTFDPGLDSIKENQVIKFVVQNKGKIDHEFSIGNQEDQIAHASMMAKMPNMTHDDPNTITVKPGSTKTLVWRFKGEDVVVFACNIPGHYQAGMFKKTAIESVSKHNSDGHSH